MCAGWTGLVCVRTRKLEVEQVIKKPDIVSLKWVIGLMNAQADNAESALVEYGNDPSQKQALLRCMWAVHQITSTLRALGMTKAEMLTLEMERTLNFVYKDKVAGERRKLAMGGLMQALKVIPAYLEHTENVRVDTGRGLGKYVNDLRRWVGERPRPSAFFFHMEIEPATGITADSAPADDEEIRKRANVMLALYLEMAKQGLRKRKVSESMVTVARISRKMQLLFAGTEAERFWFVMIGVCEGIAGGLIAPDDCIAQIFKSGAFLIKYARENGSKVDSSVDYDSYLQQMLYYIATCKSKPVHIAGIRDVFGINDNTIADANLGLVHSDALVTAITGALDHLNKAVEFLSVNDLGRISTQDPEAKDKSVLEAIEAAECRLIAAGQLTHADSLKKVEQRLSQFFGSNIKVDALKVEEAAHEIGSGIVNITRDLEHKLQHGLSSTYSGTKFELRESVATATFRQMGLVENYLHQILRRKGLEKCLEEKPQDFAGVLRLTTALQRHLNKSDKGHEELRQAIRNADNEEADIDLLYSLAAGYLDQLESMPEEEAIDESLQLLQSIADALMFSGMDREGRAMERCHKWLAATSEMNSVQEDDAFRCFADAFAQIEMHLQRSLIDPLDDTSHMLVLAEQRAAQLDKWIVDLPAVAPAAHLRELAAVAEVQPALKAQATEEVSEVGEAQAVEEERPVEEDQPVEEVQAVQSGHEGYEVLELQVENQVQDAEIPPEFREVFVEESEDIVAELAQLTSAWLQEPRNNDTLRDIRRHFHTFKGNGRAVGANILGELGWAAQDMLDRALESNVEPGETVQNLVSEVVSALPDLVESYSNSSSPDVDRIRQLTHACSEMATTGVIGSSVVTGSVSAAETLAH
jgi:hypothetical protein